MLVLPCEFDLFAQYNFQCTKLLYYTRPATLFNNYLHAVADKFVVKQRELSRIAKVSGQDLARNKCSVVRAVDILGCILTEKKSRKYRLKKGP